MRRVHIILGLICLFAYGCATTQGPTLTADQVKQIDLATGPETATILIKARPAGQQQLTTFYQINIDDRDPILIFKDSNTVLRLDAGTYHLTMAAVLGKDRFSAKDDFFGESSSRKVHLNSGDRMVLQYVGPYWMEDSGKLYLK